MLSAFRKNNVTKSVHFQKAAAALVRSFTSTPAVSVGAVADHCDLHVVSSPFPPIPNGPFDPLPEFVMSNWKGKGGALGKEHVAIIDGTTGMQRTFDDFYESTTGIAGALRYDMGVDEKSCVCLFAPNHVDHLPVTLAVGLCGAKIAPVNPLYTKDELLVILDRSRSSVLIAHEALLEVALAAAKDSKYVKHVFVMTEDGKDGMGDVENLNSLKKHGKAFDETVRTIHPETDLHPYLLPYSSGTTGLPKGVCLTHANLTANLLQCDVTEKEGFGMGEALISPLPFFHIYAMLVSSLYCGWKGNTVITMSGGFDFPLFLELIQKHRPSRAHLVPPIILALAKHPVVDNYDLSSVKGVISAAAPLGVETANAAQKRLGGCVVKQCWGMSELSPIGTLSPWTDPKDGSVGPVAPSTYGKIIDENGKSVGPNVQGELCIKGPQVMMGYLDAPDKTAECLSKGGWLRTGDVAYYDEEGYFFITDRIKELIKVRGYPVAPAEIEELLLGNDLVNDVAVIQAPDERSGELPRAYIVLKDADQASEETKTQIYEWVKERVVPYKRLDGGIVFRDAIPKSASGKILRRLLRDELKKELEEASS